MSQSRFNAGCIAYDKIGEKLGLLAVLAFDCGLIVILLGEVAPKLIGFVPLAAGWNMVNLRIALYSSLIMFGLSGLMIRGYFVNGSILKVSANPEVDEAFGIVLLLVWLVVAVLMVMS